jgi:hypothetical protein
MKKPCAVIVVTAAMLLSLLAAAGPAAASGYPWASTGGPTGAVGIRALAFDSDADILYAATGSDQVWRCRDASTSPSWAVVLGGLPADQINAMAYDPVRDYLYVGTDTQGVWSRSSPNTVGPSWTDISGATFPTLRITAMGYDPEHNDLFAGLYNDTIWRLHNPNSSTSWGDTGGPMPGGSWFNAIVYDTGKDRLYCGINYSSIVPGSGGVWRCNNPNQPSLPLTWVKTGGDTADLTVLALEVDSAGNRLYATSRNTTDGRYEAWRCDAPDGTVPRTWTDLDYPDDYSALAGCGISLDTAGGMLYVVSNEAGGGVWRCVQPDGSPSWFNTGGALQTDGGTAVLAGPGTNRLFAGLVGAEVYSTTITYPTWYLAEGSTAWGYSTYVSIQNPNPTAVTALVTYMTDTGPVDGGELELPADSQTTVFPADLIGARDFSTMVESLDGLTIAVDRTMTWTGQGASSPEAHTTVGVTYPARTWYLPEGSSKWGFECWLTVQNPNDREATCDITYMIEESSPVTVSKAVGANSRGTFFVADDIGSADASIQVDSDLPVIPERTMYRNSRREGHNSIGTTGAAASYYLAEGTTDWGFTTYVCIQNPNSSPVEVDLTYMTDGGPVPHPENPVTMPADSRETIRVNDFLPGEDFSTQVEGSQPIIAERAMYWDNGTGEACHDSIGMDAAHAMFFLPDGETSNGRETWICVQNPNDYDVTVRVTYMTESGAGNVTFDDTVEADSRKTFDMADRMPSARAATKVESRTSGGMIMVERAMYWNARGAGTDTIGGYSD